MSNNQKLHEVLRSASERLLKATESEKFGEDVLYLVGCMRSVAQELQSALAKPPRNCDMFDNANDAFAAYAKEQMPEPNSYDDWLFAEADSSHLL